MRRAASRRGGLLALPVLLVVGSAGCSQAVEIEVPAFATQAPCPQPPWPQQVAGHDRVATSSDSNAVAAWGDPPIIARCGVAAPGPTTLECLGVDDVDWIVEPLSDGTRFTTYGRKPAMQVLVPDAYSPEPMVLGSFTLVAGRLPGTGRRCR